MSDILLSPEAAKFAEERNAKIAEEQELTANNDFKKFCEDRGVIPDPIIQMEFSGMRGIRIIGTGTAFISKLRIKPEPTNGKAT
jgi:hypothetical protein